MDMNPSNSISSRGAMAIGLLCLGLLLTTGLRADNSRIIELVDGSQIAGEIVLFEHGVYTIESSSLGRLHIPDSDIRVIRSGGLVPSRQSSPPSTDPDRLSAAGLTHYESQIVGDPQILSLVMALQNDPDVLAVLNDPSVMQAIAARDLNALQDNAKILKLENNPTIRQILDLVGRK